MFWFVIRWLHLLAMAFFLGGQMLLVAAVVPVERAAEDRERLRAIARRFGQGTAIAIGVLAATGAAMATHSHLWGDRTFQAKLGLVLVLLALIAWHLRRPTMHALDAAIFLITLAIVWIGLYLANGYS